MCLVLAASQCTLHDCVYWCLSLFLPPEPSVSAQYCSVVLDDSDVELLTYAIKNHYWYQGYIDDLPVWGLVGEMLPNSADSSGKLIPHVYTHRELSFGYSGNQIVEVNMTAAAPVPVDSGEVLALTYAVHWTASSQPFVSRFRRYLDHGFFEHDIHWLSLFNSFMLVLFMVGVVALILARTLRADVARYLSAEEAADVEALANLAATDEGGWKQCHGDVWRPPVHMSLLAALVGAGCQLLAMAAAVLGTGIVAALHWYERGTLTGIILGSYALTSIVNGGVSAHVYKNYFPAGAPTPGWASTALLSGSLMPGTALIMVGGLNVVAAAYGTTNQVPFTTILGLLALWLVVSAPLTAVGSITARRMQHRAPAARVSMAPRPLPAQRPWYTAPVTLCALAGLLPFGAVAVETYYVLSSFATVHKFYYVYGFMLLVTCVLVVVAACVAVVATYALLGAEDWRWPWVAWASGATSGVYVFIYGAWYYLVRTYMSGFLQAVFFFSYLGMASAAVGLLAGGVAYLAARRFVRLLFSSVKME